MSISKSGKPIIILFSSISLLLILCISCSPAQPGSNESTNVVLPADPTPESTAAAPVEEIETPEGPVPDIIYHNGIVLTMEEDQPQAEAISILGDEILAVGSEDAILALSGPDTQVIDLGGRTMVPGFIDSHGHWIGSHERIGYNTVDETVQYMLENGWTSINEMYVSPERLEVLVSLDRNGRLRVRVNAYMVVNSLADRFDGPYELGYSPRQVLSPHVRLAGVKMSLDVKWGNVLLWEQEELNKEVLDAHNAGWQLAIHADMVDSLSMALEALSLALQGEDNSAYRHRIEHVIAITDEQLATFQAQRYIASIQLNLPGNIPYLFPVFYDLVPEEDYPLLTRWEDIHQAGILIAGGTDWPWMTNNTVVELGNSPAGSPIRLLYKAVTHTDPNDVVPEDWMFDQYLPVDVALQSLTINGAYATFEEDVKGSLAPGKWADIVILSDNPLNVSLDALKDIEVLMTMIGGKVEYCAIGAEALCGQGQAADTSEAVEGEILVQPGSSIEIGIQGPATGPLAAFYPHMWNVAQMAVVDYGLILEEFPITLVQINDGCDQSATASAAEQLLAEHPQVIGVIGPFCSDSVRGSMPIYQKADLVVVSGSATEEDLSVLFGAGGFNRTILNDQQLSDLGLTYDYIDSLASVKSFYTRYEEQFGPLPTEIRSLIVYTYDAVQVLLSAIENAAVRNEDGSITLDRTALAEAVRAIEDFVGLTGPIVFDEHGDRIP